MENTLALFKQAIPADLDFDYELIQKFPRAFWFSTDRPDIHIGYDGEWAYIECPVSDALNIPREFQVWHNNHSSLVARFAPNAWSQKFLSEKTPAWFDPAIAFPVLARDYHHYRELPAGKTGRFVMQFEVVTSERDAYWLSNVRDYPMDQIIFDPGVEILLNNHESYFTGHPIQVWSDGRVTAGDCDCEPAITTSQDILDALKAALRMKEWKIDQRWRKLLTLEVERKVKIHHGETHRNGFTSYSADVDVFRWDTNLGALYHVSFGWGAMGEDGDGGDSYYLYENEAEAVMKAKELLK